MSYKEERFSLNARKTSTLLLLHGKAVNFLSELMSETGGQLCTTSAAVSEARGAVTFSTEECYIYWYVCWIHNGERRHASAPGVLQVHHLFKIICRDRFKEDYSVSACPSVSKATISMGRACFFRTVCSCCFSCNSSSPREENKLKGYFVGESIKASPFFIFFNRESCFFFFHVSVLVSLHLSPCFFLSVISFSHAMMRVPCPIYQASPQVPVYDESAVSPQVLGGKVHLC